MRKNLGLTLAVAFLFLASLGYGVPGLINYQGKLVDSTTGEGVTGSRDIAFTIYDAETNGNVLWQETQNVRITDGLFNVLLGDTTPIPASVFDGDSRFLGIKIGTGAEGSPRHRLVSVGYAMTADNLGGGAVVDENGNVGIGTMQPSEELEVSGTVKATRFVGDGSGLTGISGGGTEGPAGPQGEKGDTGDTGPQGVKGDKGDTGSIGPIGAKGDKGDTGLQGIQGVAGIKGDTGPQGVKGDKGDTGSQGIQGVAGNKGDTGLQGIQGVKGDKGDTGLQGVKGDKGDTGSVGPKGDTGDTGPTLGIYDSLGLGSSGGRLSGDAGGRTLYNLGSVGIGTTEPLHSLDVRGNVLGYRLIAGSALTASNGELLLRDSAGSETIGLFANPVTSGKSNYINSGNVGIGTTSPDATLHVDGSPGNIRVTTQDTGFSPQVAVIGGTGHSTYIRAAYIDFTGNVNSTIGSSSTGFFIDVPVGGFTDRTVSVNNGNVGIGTTEPQAKLHVSGVMRLEPQATAPSGGLGDLYVGTDGKLYFHNGTAWKEVQLAP